MKHFIVIAFVVFVEICFGQLSGKHAIISKMSNKAFDVMGSGKNASIIHFKTHYRSNQVWEIKPVANGYYKIISEESGMPLDIKNKSKEKGAFIVQYTRGNSDSQLWKIEPIGKFYKIISKHSGMALDIQGYKIVQKSVSNSNSQLWKLKYLFTSDPYKISDTLAIKVDKVVAKLRQIPGVTEASIFPWIEHRELPNRLYRKYSHDVYNSTYMRDYIRVKGQFFRIRYRCSDGIHVEGVVALPKRFSLQKKYPVLIYNHGNSGSGGQITAGNISRIEDIGLKKDFVVFASQYRGVAGSEGRDNFNVLDVIDILNVARQCSFVDKYNVFMLGFSRGGMMTYLALKHGAKLNAAAAVSSMLDVTPQAQRDRSAVYWPEKISSPIIILHGKKDTTCPVTGIPMLAKKLAKLNKPHKLIVYPNAGHSLSGTGWQKQAHLWFKKYRKD